MLKEKFLEPNGLTQRELANHLGVDFKVINRIINNKSAITPKMAIKLAATFETDASLWLEAQNMIDIQKAASELGENLPSSIIAIKTNVIG